MKKYATVTIDEMYRVKLPVLFCADVGISPKSRLYAFQRGVSVVLSPESAPCPQWGATLLLI